MNDSDHATTGTIRLSTHREAGNRPASAPPASQFFRRTIVGTMLLCAMMSSGAHATVPPPPGSSWDWQLSRPLNLSVRVKVLDLDPDLVSRDTLRRLKARGIYLVCYVSVGTWENWRRDRKRFPRQLLGRAYDKWPDERFLDIRRITPLLPIMRARFERCRRLGFDAVEADNIDLHEQRTGFPIRARHVVRYARALAAMAHELGLAIAQKNAPGLALLPFMDFAIVEECFQQGWCARMRPYLDRGRPVFAAEYRLDRRFMRRACARAKRLGI